RLAMRPARLDLDGRAFDIADITQPLAQAVKSRRSNAIGKSRMEKSDDRHFTLLRPRRERPRSGSATEKCDEIPPPHSITSSASARNLSGTITPSAFAVLRLITISNLVG